MVDYIRDRPQGWYSVQTKLDESYRKLPKWQFVLSDLSPPLSPAFDVMIKF